MLQTLDLIGLDVLNGGLVTKMLAAEFRKAADDIVGGRDVPEARTITLTISLKPDYDKSLDELRGVVAEFQTRHGHPKRITSARLDIRMNESRQREFVFETNSPDNPDQLPLPFNKQEKVQ